LLLIDLTDEEWAAIKPLLPPMRTLGANAPIVLRRSVNGILWRMRTGAPWRLMPPEYGNWYSIRRRFQNWSSSGAWQNVARALATQRNNARRCVTFDGASPCMVVTAYRQAAAEPDLT
jgi:transposase